MKLPPRPRDGHKGMFGTVLGIGGSRGMSGAIALFGKAALLAGAGLVRLAVPDPILETVAAFAPEPTTVPLPSDRRGRITLDAAPVIRAQMDRATVIAVGPGLGRSLGLDALLARLYREIDKPCIFDADALNALAARNTFAPGDDADFSKRGPTGPPRILTPHPGEFARLCPAYDAVRHNARSVEEIAKRFAKRNGIILVLKGRGTLVTDGVRTASNDTGNPGMGTGGSGDVLTGILAGLLTQFHETIDTFELVRFGVRLHGLAGDAAARTLGEESVSAGSLIDYLPAAFCSLREAGLQCERTNPSL